jgi:hypothetical protein
LKKSLLSKQNKQAMSAVNDSFLDQKSGPGFTSTNFQLYPNNSSGMEIKLSEVNSFSSKATTLASKNNSIGLDPAISYHFVTIWKH